MAVARPGTRSLYFARWIERALPGMNVTLLAGGGGSGNAFGGVCGRGAEMSIKLGRRASLEVRTGERVYSAMLPPDSEECLMHEELSILGRDPGVRAGAGLMDVRQFADGAAAVEACGKQILEWLREAIAQSGRATLAISGGSSPQPMFERFSRTPFDWERVHLFWVDERGVPPTDSQSNFKFAQDAWLRPAIFRQQNIHRIQAELDPAEAAARYVADIQKFFGLAEGELPHFDVMHRGMGPDAHTASLFPGEALIDNRTGIAAAVWVEKFQQWRITLLPGVLLAARHTALLATGADKAAALRSVLHSPFDPQHYPAQIASGEGTVWFVDAAAQEA